MSNMQSPAQHVILTQLWLLH